MKGNSNTSVVVRDDTYWPTADESYDFRIGGTPVGFSLMTSTVILYWNFVIYGYIYFLSFLLFVADFKMIQEFRNYFMVY